jgi:WD40 repeat protein
LLFTLDGHTSLIVSVVVSDDGTAIATASGGQLRLWDAANGQVRLEIKQPDVGSDGLLFDPSGKIIASGTGAVTAGRPKPPVQLWDAVTGAKLAELPGQSSRLFTAVAFNIDGSRIATAFGKTIRLYDTTTGQEMFNLPLDVEGEAVLVLALAFVPERGRLIAVLNDGSIRAWEAPGEKHTNPTPSPQTVSK